MATKAQIAQKVLEKLGVLESGATGEAADITIVEDKYDSWYKILAKQNLVSWGSGDNIPTESVTSIVAIVANDCLSEFIIPQDKQIIVSRDADKGMTNLIILENVDYVPEETEPHHF